MFILFKAKKEFYLADDSEIKNNCWYIHEDVVTGKWDLFQSDNVYDHYNNPNYIDPRIFIHKYVNWNVIASTEQLGCTKMMNRIKLDDQLSKYRNKRWFVESYEIDDNGYCDIKILE